MRAALCGAGDGRWLAHRGKTSVQRSRKTHPLGRARRSGISPGIVGQYPAGYRGASRVAFDQASRIGVSRIVEDVAHRSGFDHFSPAYMNHNPVAQLGDDNPDDAR